MRKLVFGGVVVIVLLVAAVVVWQVLDRDEETTRGTCGGLSYEVSTEDEQSEIELTFELQSAGPGETWSVVIEQDGQEVLSGDRVTDEDGELDAEVLVPESNGTSFTVTATPEGGGDACEVSVEA